jgi:hypothetical protein
MTDKPAMRSAEEWAKHWEENVSPNFRGIEDYLNFLRAVQQDAIAFQRAARSDDFPAGAIHNGEVFIERIDGNSGNPPEWEELKKCFHYLADYVQRVAPPKPE